MSEEIEAVCSWWTNQLKRSMLNSSKIDDKQNEILGNFKNSLKNILTLKYEKHWFVEDPVRGSAYRSLCYDHCMDPVLWKAGEQCGLQLRRLESLLAHTRSVIVFVNPGEVKMMTIIGGSHKSHPELIWMKGKTINKIPEPELDLEGKNIELDSDSDEEAMNNNKDKNSNFNTSFASPKASMHSKNNTPSKPFDYRGYNPNHNPASHNPYPYDPNFYPTSQYSYSGASYRSYNPTF